MIAERAEKGAGVQPVGAEASTPARNVYQRKAAVTAKVGTMVTDKVHPAHKFPYMSIQNVSNHVRQFCLDEGLDPNISIAGDVLVLELVNVDNPDERITSTWPLVPQDKAWSYTTKYALVRTFLIGDSEENDEATMADGHAAQSATTASATSQQAQGRPEPANGRTAPQGGGNRPLGPCVACVTIGAVDGKGEPPQFWPNRKEGQPPQCNGRKQATDGHQVFMNHPMPQPSVRSEAEDMVPLEAYSDGP